MTSNLPSAEEVRSHFRPEFLNRIDEIILFHSLSEEHLKRIVDIQLTRVAKRLEERHIHLTLTTAAKEHLISAEENAAHADLEKAPEWGATPG